METENTAIKEKGDGNKQAHSWETILKEQHGQKDQESVTWENKREAYSSTLHFSLIYTEIFYV